MPSKPEPPLPIAGRSVGLTVCHGCGLVCHAPAGAGIRCRHCGARAHPRIPRSLEKASAYLVTAAILYVPANLLPVMHTRSLLADQDDTILSGVVFLARSGSWPLAALVFVASILIPLMKILVLGFLVGMSALGSRRHRLPRTRLYRFVDFIGRWSLLDVYAVMMLAALVQMGSMATVQPGPGALAFGAVVVLTLLATESFDPRVIWDGEGEANG